MVNPLKKVGQAGPELPAVIAAFPQYSQYSARLGRLRVESKPGLNTSRIVEVLRVFPRQ
jgi:hypothetical protein